MTFTSVEIIALSLLALATIKIIILLIKPQVWLNFAKTIYGGKSVTKIVSFVLAGLVFYYLIQELTIVQIFAATAFVALLMVIGMSDIVGRFITVYKKKIKAGTLWRDYWFYTLVWVVLMVWTAIELF